MKKLVLGAGLVVAGIIPPALVNPDIAYKKAPSASSFIAGCNRLHFGLDSYQNRSEGPKFDQKDCGTPGAYKVQVTYGK